MFGTQATHLHADASASARCGALQGEHKRRANPPQAMPPTHHGLTNHQAGGTTLAAAAIGHAHDHWKLIRIIHYTNGGGEMGRAGFRPTSHSQRWMWLKAAGGRLFERETEREKGDRERERERTRDRGTRLSASSESLRREHGNAAMRDPVAVFASV